MRDAGINVKRTVLPGTTFWNNWIGYPFSATEWNMRPLGVQIYALAYKSGGAWNETGFCERGVRRPARPRPTPSPTPTSAAS